MKNPNIVKPSQVEILELTKEFFIGAYECGNIAMIKQVLEMEEVKIHEKAKPELIEIIQKQFELLNVKSTIEKTEFITKHCHYETLSLRIRNEEFNLCSH